MQGNILILSSGRRVSLVNAFRQSVVKSGLSIKIFAGDAKPELSAACQVADKSVQLPFISDPQFIPFLVSYCVSENIRLIIPTIDTELLILSENIKLFSENNIIPLVSDFDFIKICRNKRLTHQFFQNAGVSVARETDVANENFPVFIKPVDGSSSVNIYLARNKAEIPPYVIGNDKFLILEYLDRKKHTEYTIDAYYSSDGRLCCAVPRKRIETRGGEISKGVTCKNFLVAFMRNTFGYHAGLRGCITFQFFVNDDSSRITGIEINPRFGGGFPLSYLAGAEFPLWIINEYFSSKKIEWTDNWEDHLLMLRYDNEILIHDYQGR